MTANLRALVGPVLPEPVGERAGTDDAEKQPRGIIGTEKPIHSVPRRTPDVKKSRERLAFFETVATELATIKQDLGGYCTAKLLKNKHPGFVVFKHLSKQEVQEIVDGESFFPRTFAESITLRKFGITSSATLKKDRSKVKRAERGG